MTVSQLLGVTYHWRKTDYPDKEFDDQEHIGFIAQEINEVLPNVVVSHEKGYMSVDYSRITTVLVEAMKEPKPKTMNLKPKLYI